MGPGMLHGVPGQVVHEVLSSYSVGTDMHSRAACCVHLLCHSPWVLAACMLPVCGTSVPSTSMSALSDIKYTLCHILTLPLGGLPSSEIAEIA